MAALCYGGERKAGTATEGTGYPQKAHFPRYWNECEKFEPLWAKYIVALTGYPQKAHFPRYWNECEKFEPLWAKYIVALNEACRRLRRK